MKILILGAGQVGSTAAFSLAREEANEVTIVDRNADVLRELQDRLDVRTVVGNASYPDVLERAGARDADMLIALTSSDEINMLACQIALTLFKTPTRIARIRARELIANEALFGPGGIPVDVAISPSSLVTDYIAQLIRFPGALQVLEFADGKVRLVATRADRGGALVGHPLRDLHKHIPNVESRVVAIYRGGKGIIPDGDTVVEEGDEVFFLAARKDARTVLREMRKLDEPARKVVIAGGGNIGLDLARALEGAARSRSSSATGSARGASRISFRVRSCCTATRPTRSCCSRRTSTAPTCSSPSRTPRRRTSSRRCWRSGSARVKSWR